MIIAFDFDGVLCKDAFPAIGEEITYMTRLCRDLLAAGHEVILWTCRVDECLSEAVQWCRERGIEFSAVNEQAPSNLKMYEGVYKTTPRKVYADYYIDDRNIEFPGKPDTINLRRKMYNEEDR